MDDNKRAEIEESVREFNKRAAKLHSSRATYVSQEDLETGRRTIVTTVVHELECAGIGHAIQARGDPFDAEVATLLSLGRAYQGLGKRMVERGLMLSKEYDKIAEAVNKAFDKKWPEFVRRVQPPMTNDQWRKFHESRLADAVKEGKVIQCSNCKEYFGIKGKRMRRVMQRVVPEGMKKRYVREYLCPHCVGWSKYWSDLRGVSIDIEAFKVNQARRKLLKALCDACGVDECPGPDKDPCDEAKAVLDSKSQPPQTGALEGEPGPSVPTGTEGRAVNPQGDDGPRCLVCEKPTTFHLMDGKEGLCVTVDHAIPLDREPYLCHEHYLEAKERSKRGILALMDPPMKATSQGDDGMPHCALCGKPFVDGDIFATTGSFYYHHPGCSKGLPIDPSVTITMKKIVKPQGDDGQAPPPEG